MSAFKDGSWTQRVGTMGDPAEQKLLEVYPNNLVRWGLDRPPLQVSKLPKRIRFAPDYLASDCFIECQGLGRDQIVKVKIQKLGALLWWNDLFPVKLFLWDSHFTRHCLVHVHVLTTLIDQGQVSLGWFHEGICYYAFPADAVFGGE